MDWKWREAISPCNGISIPYTLRSTFIVLHARNAVTKRYLYRVTMTFQNLRAFKDFNPTCLLQVETLPGIYRTRRSYMYFSRVIYFSVLFSFLFIFFYFYQWWRLYLSTIINPTTKLELRRSNSLENLRGSNLASPNHLFQLLFGKRCFWK